MSLLKASRFTVKNPVLKQCIKYFWVMQTEQNTAIYHKLLPVNNIDFVLNFSTPIKYVIDQTVIVPKNFHFIGLRNQHYLISQEGSLNIFGISFFPSGLYPFLKTPLSEFTNRTVELELLANKFTAAIEDKLSITGSVTEKLEIIEKELMELIDIKLMPNENINKLYNSFHASMDSIKIQDFCRDYGINQRRLERLFGKYIGISPKLYAQINRFQRVVNNLVNSNSTLVSLAYAHEYWDQTHFIKDFKVFTGCTPSQFLKERSSVKEILKTN